MNLKNPIYVYPFGVYLNHQFFIINFKYGHM